MAHDTIRRGYANGVMHIGDMIVERSHRSVLGETERCNRVVLRGLGRGGEITGLSSMTDGDAMVVFASRSLNAEQLRRQLIAWRRRVPWAPIILCVRDETDLCALAPAAFGVARAVISSAVWSLQWIHRQLSDYSDLGRHCRNWVGIQRPDIRSRVLEAIQRLVDDACEAQVVRRVAVKETTTLRTLQDYFKRAALPNPAQYTRFGRLMRGLSAITEGSTASEVAGRSGYSRYSAFVRMLEASVGVSVSDAASRLGFEWAAHRLRLNGRDG